MRITRELLEQGQSKAGGWSREQLRLLGVNWPPKRGWPAKIVGSEITDAEAARFLELNGAHLKSAKIDHARKIHDQMDQALNFI